MAWLLDHFDNWNMKLTQIIKLENMNRNINALVLPSIVGTFSPIVFLTTYNLSLQLSTKRFYMYFKLINMFLGL